MNQVIYIFILFNILFLIERKAINKLLTFVGIIITTALLLADNMKIIEGTYISYILILIEVSALTILFGFIIMLFPGISTRTVFHPILDNEKKADTRQLYSLFLFFLIILLILILFLEKNQLFSDLWALFSNPLSYSVGTYNTSLIQGVSSRGEGILISTGTENNFIRKIGLLFFTENSSIFKLIIITLILLFAIIALFFFF